MPRKPALFAWLLVLALPAALLLPGRAPYRVGAAAGPSLPDSDCPRYRWVDPTPDPANARRCGNCHAEIHAEWQAGGHARSLTSTFFRTLYDGSDASGQPGRGWSLLADHPDGAAVCASCHAPTAFDEPAGDFDLRSVAETRGALSGVHCDFCHKVVGPGPGEYGLTHGRYQLELLRPDPNGEPRQVIFGPLRDPTRGENVFSPFYRDSRYCAACHEGVVFGVHVYSTYLEWLESPARRHGKECQTCHMAPTGRMTNVAPGHGGKERDPLTLGNHHFFDGSQADMLRRCLSLGVTAARGAGQVTAEVRVVATGVGHRVPTGFPDRQVLLAVEGIDPQGRAVLPTDGPTLPRVVGGALAGQAGRLYAKVLRDFDGNSPVPFWRARPEFTDTRLRPEVADESRYVFPPEVRQVRARLLYRRFWHEVAEVKGWRGNTVTIRELVRAVGLEPRRGVRR
ncbi:MAG TPA: multiheme c-type cytochrome [Gemmataceae bacterium]